MMDNMTVLVTMPAVANYKPSGLNQHKYILSWFSGVRSSKSVSLN